MPDHRSLTILQVLSWLEYGGVETYVIRLSRALSALGHRVIVASCGGRLVPELEASGIRHVSINFTGCRAIPGARAIRRLIQREQVDIVNAHNWRAGMVTYLAAKPAGVPYLLTVHGTRNPSRHFGVFYWSELVAVVSEASRRNIVDDFGLARERVLKTIIGVDCRRFHPAPRDPELERELGLTPGAPRVVNVSRFSHSKAPVALALIQAAPALSARLPTVEIIAVGQGPEERAVFRAAEAMNARLGRRAIFALGGRSDVERILTLADVAVATASVAMEAMASGKPVIAAGKGGYFGLITPENLEQAEFSCFADHHPIAPLHPNRIAADLLPLLTDSERVEYLGQENRRAAEARYSTPVLAKDVDGIYRKALCRPTDIEQIAVFHLNQIGDLVFTLPALKALREGFPRARITSVLRPHLAGLVRHSGFVDDIVFRPPGGPAAAVHLGLGLRKLRPDLAVALSQSATMAICAWLSGAPNRIGFIDSDVARFLTHRVQERGIPCPEKVMHLVRCLGLTPEKADYVGLVRLSPEDEETGARLIDECALAGAGPLLALAPGESTEHPYKSWSAAGFAGVAHELARDLDARLIVVGGDRDHPLGDEIIAGLGARAANLAGRTTPSELAAVLSHCDLLIGIDSGPMHVAAAMGRPVVGIFGPTNPYRTGPQGERHRVIFHQQPCWPCMSPTCYDRPCMSSITVQEVVSAARELL